MAKFKPIRQKGKEPPKAGALPCAILVLTGILLLSVLFYYVLASGVR